MRYNCVTMLCCGRIMWLLWYTTKWQLLKYTVSRIFYYVTETCSRVIYFQGWMVLSPNDFKEFSASLQFTKNQFLPSDMGLSDMSFLAFYAFRHVLFLFPLIGFLSFYSLCCFSNFFYCLYHSSAGHSWSATVLVFKNILQE